MIWTTLKKKISTSCCKTSTTMETFSGAQEIEIGIGIGIFLWYSCCLCPVLQGESRICVFVQVTWIVV